MRRSVRAVVTGLVVLTCASFALVAGAAAPAALAAGSDSGTDPGSDGATATDTAPPADSTLVAVPFRAEAEVAMADGWTVADCGNVAAPTDFAVACEPSRLTVTAPVYDPDRGTSLMPVLLANGPVTMVVTYRLSMAPPTPPSAAELTYDYPAQVGDAVLLPLSDLGVRCDGCASTGPGIEVTGVSPASSAVARVTSTHLVVQGAPGFVGDVTVSYRLRDGFGQTSETTSATIAFTRPAPGGEDSGRDGLVALAVAAPFAAEGPTTVDLSALTFAEGDVTLLGCGPAVTGSVECAGGTATYQPLPPVAGREPSDVDQFSFHVTTPDGRQATGSVTLVRGDAADTLKTGPLASSAADPADGDGDDADRDRDRAFVRTLVPTLPADDEDAPDAPVTGLFSPLISVLDRLGGTP
ncbi:hypothetical protein ACPEEZ_01480 [Frigoribacterium sp. 2-23]|uniref:hypothetical protein n=1 Tax=Frigoribacterium sp. 2-23 TaxID=3415006 RepID=UPI003C6FBBB2